MSDGNTGLPMAPVPSEDDMNKFRAMFDNALNSILVASELGKQLAALKADFESLKHDMEYVRNRNRELDQAVVDVRSQRDMAMRERDEAKHEVNMLNNQAQGNAKEINDLKDRNAALWNELDAVKKDRDNAYSEWHKADEAKASAEAKLADIEAHMAKAFGLAQPEPTHTPVEVPAYDPNWDKPEAQPQHPSEGSAYLPSPTEPWKHD